MPVKVTKPLSPGEEAFALHLRAERIFYAEREYHFHPQRKWRFDFALLEPKIAVEIEGGTWIQGRHQRGGSYEVDCEKYNAAVKMGWRVLRYSTEMVMRGDAINDVLEILKGQEL
jgi:very-short-patch-repair endonuclease